jgi:hypothetical protein
MSSRMGIASCALVVAALTGCGSNASGHPAPEAFLTVWPPSPTVVAGAAEGTEILAYSSSRDGVTWALDGPGTLSDLAGLRTVYAPPDVLDADRVVTVTATAGSLQASTGVRVVAPPFDLDPRTLSVAAGDAPVPIRLVPRDPSATFQYTVIDPDLGDVRVAGDVVWYLPPTEVAAPATAWVSVVLTDTCDFSMDSCYSRVATVTVNPGP